jgi:hypothetical protein
VSVGSFAGLGDALGETIERAARLSPYYREVFAGLDKAVRSVDDVRRFPLLTREILIERTYDMLADGAVPITVSLSGGTTGAVDGLHRPVLTFHDEEESRARRAVLDASYGALSPQPLFMHLVNLGHGYDTSAALEGAFQMALERPFHFQAILSVLRHRFSFPGFTPRVRGLAGALRLLKALTLLCQEGGIDGADFEIELVSSSSSHLTSRWRGVLAEYWGAEIDETYGLSEVPGLHARRCTACGHFHFAPLAVVEILALGSDEPVEAGVGRVVATSLYPLAAIQPIIRYDTGDAVDIVGHCDFAGTFGFAFLGRVADAPMVPGSSGRATLLSPIVVNEVLDGDPRVATEQFAFAKALGLDTGVGYQKWGFRLDGDRHVLELAIEMSGARSGCSSAFGLEVRDRIMSAAPGLAEAVDGGVIEFRTVLHEQGSTNLKAIL